jgi:ribosomal protein S18 acetylase RimI-like enzyme
MLESPVRREISIRRARLEDAETIARMVAALSEAEGGLVPRFDAAACRRDGFGATPRFEVLLAEAAGRLAGYALFHPSYDTDRVVQAVYLGDLYVEAWARGAGIGRLLAATVARIAAARGEEAMHWTVLRRNTAARRFYARFAREDDRLLHFFADAEGLARLAASAPLSGVALRTAEPGDAPLLGRLLSRLLTAVGEEALPFDAGPRLAGHGFGPAPRFRALIAEQGSEVAGYALYWPIYDTDTGGPLMFLSDLLVEEHWRGRGLALDLMAAIAREGMAAGHRGMLWEVLRHNARARAFYRRMAEESDEAIVVNCADDDFRRLAAEGMAVTG